MQKSDLQRFHRSLQGWYAAHGRRTLPWRNTKDAYAIYISEIMLQQTQVKTVLERYYFQFLKTFPTLQTLAAATQDEVMSAWQGLGYYRRAANLHETAKRCKTALPDTVEGLLALPGIGRNTAHAVAAFAYRAPVPVMEANVARVVARIFALETPSVPQLWEKAAILLNCKDPFDYNQAMMDIGTIVCKKRSPLCGECPANGICQGKSSPESYPAAKRAKPVPVREKHIVVLRNRQGEIYAAPRTGKFLGGLYHFVEADHADTHVAFSGKRYALAAASHLGDITQQYSHFTLAARVYSLRVNHSGKQWHSESELAKLPVSMAEKKILKLIGLP